MKALTVCQPYANMIAIGEKQIENREWPTNYRGLLAIHAGKSRDWLDGGDEERYPGMAYGAIVAVARLNDCIPVALLVGAWRSDPHANGPYCWLLNGVRRLTAPALTAARTHQNE